MATTEEKFEQWVHVKITDKELAEQLDAICESDQRDRSKTLRWLIQEEWKRRAVLDLAEIKKVKVVA